MDIENLQHTVKWLGDQVSILSTKMLLRCDWNSTQICVTPVLYNVSQEWNRIKRNLEGHSNITEEILALQEEITATFSRKLPQLTGQEMLNGLTDGLANLNPLGHVQTLLTATFGNTFVIMLLCFLAYIVYRRWSQRRVKKKLREKLDAVIAHVKNEK
uniref:Retroviral envelope protein GP41-like domain-containing protein n=1 Tax=Molossus molossus TaxID=27622 RepID=A0A7J8F977_MOLMO|nr:hypothetical protein HJG59_008458 [Molossus molossus]